ncbi:MAG: hypothetical protein IPL61_06890 [Myxococcales bacterium]|nr:hypothetical protein [Myxococcales bacterium]
MSPIVYLFVALAVRRRAELIVGLCRAHATARRKQHVIGWGLVALAVALVAVAIALGAAILGLLVPIALVIGVVMIGLAGHIVRVRSIDHNTARISNGSPRLREGLPDLPGRLW